MICINCIIFNGNCGFYLWLWSLWLLNYWLSVFLVCCFILSILILFFEVFLVVFEGGELELFISLVIMCLDVIEF